MTRNISDGRTGALPRAPRYFETGETEAVLSTEPKAANRRIAGVKVNARALSPVVKYLGGAAKRRGQSPSSRHPSKSNWRRLFGPVAALMLATLASSAAAQTYGCRGVDPSWTLEIRDAGAIFDFGRRFAFEIPLVSTPENRDFPKVYTMIVAFETAIVILDHDACALPGQDFPMSADILTQRGETPIVLTGCCRASE